MVRKTKLMKQVEERYGRPLDRLLTDMYNEKGLPAMAEELGVSKAALWYWLLKFGISVQRVALAPGQRLKVEEAPAELLRV